MFGRLYKLFNVKPIFLASIAIALLGSTLSATATTSASFIVGRAVCGFACAGIVAGAFTMLRMCVPLRKRAMYAGIFGGVECLSTIGAPMLGGVLVEKLSALLRCLTWFVFKLRHVSTIRLALVLLDQSTAGIRNFWFARWIDISSQLCADVDSRCCIIPPGSPDDIYLDLQAKVERTRLDWNAAILSGYNKLVSRPDMGRQSLPLGLCTGNRSLLYLWCPARSVRSRTMAQTGRRNSASTTSQAQKCRCRGNIQLLL